jgi:ferredoxin-NADP reductase
VADFEVVVGRRETVAENVVRLTLRHPRGAPLPLWTPGAHVDLVLGPGLVRQYSLCGDPADRSAYQVAVLLQPSGRGGSRHVHSTLVEGRTVRVRGPRNHFPLVDASRYLFVAGGIGITPIVPMIRAVAARGAPWQLLYGGRTRASMAFARDLVVRYGDRVVIRPEDETGLLDLPSFLTPDTETYCCGPEPLLTTIEQLHPTRLHVERFTPAAVDGQQTSFEVELAQSGRTLAVPPDGSILQAVEDAGIPVLSSCREGTCGTCETAVLEGSPDHRDSVLDAQERAAGDVMMICVSRSHTPRLVLDL